MTTPYLTADEAAQFLGLSRSGFDKWLRKNPVPQGRVGRSRRFRADDLDAWVMRPHVKAHGSTLRRTAGPGKSIPLSLREGEPC